MGYMYSFAPSRRRSRFIQQFTASHPACQLLEKVIPQTMFVNVFVCVFVCEKRAKREGKGDIFAVSVRL